MTGGSGQQTMHRSRATGAPCQGRERALGTERHTQAWHRDSHGEPCKLGKNPSAVSPGWPIPSLVNGEGTIAVMCHALPPQGGMASQATHSRRIAPPGVPPRGGCGPRQGPGRHRGAGPPSRSRASVRDAHAGSQASALVSSSAASPTC
jgi:hypothetical protein